MGRVAGGDPALALHQPAGHADLLPEGGTHRARLAAAGQVDRLLCTRRPLPGLARITQPLEDLVRAGIDVEGVDERHGWSPGEP